ncbi:MAG: hypothetical protein K0Q57_538 [Gammaproteobacteria bacterium]|nr:hypothetical protein [Gammaproteobacteria bacterium]
MLAIKNNSVLETKGFSGWYGLAKTWQEASTAKKCAMVGGAIFALSAVAIGVGLAIGFGVPPQAIMQGLKYGYEGVMAAKHAYDLAGGLYNAVTQYFAKDSKTEQGSKIELQKDSNALPFMKTFQASEPQVLTLAAAAA